MRAEDLKEFGGGFFGVAGLERGIEGKDFRPGCDGLQDRSHVGGGRWAGAEQDGVDGVEA